VIRRWVLPLNSEVNYFGDTFDGKNYSVSIIQNEDQAVVWDLSYHPF